MESNHDRTRCRRWRRNSRILNIVAAAEGNSAPGAAPGAITHVCCVPRNSLRYPPYPSLTDRMAGVSLPYAPLAATRINTSVFEEIPARIGASAE